MNTSSSLKSADYITIQREHNQVVDKAIRAVGYGIDKNGGVGLTWTTAALLSAKQMMDLILPSMFDDDVITDFGARDGHVADWILSKYAMPVTCVELVPEYAEICENSGHVTYCENLEHMSLKDGSVDWGFSHHTLEHVQDLGVAAKEITRVTKRGLFLAFPIEDDVSFAKNPSHMHHSLDPDYFIKHFEALGWKRGWWEGPGEGNPRQDYQVFLYK